VKKIKRQKAKGKNQNEPAEISALLSANSIRIRLARRGSKASCKANDPPLDFFAESCQNPDALNLHGQTLQQVWRINTRRAINFQLGFNPRNAKKKSR
jgi:hypothetical protein